MKPAVLFAAAISAGMMIPAVPVRAQGQAQAPAFQPFTVTYVLSPRAAAFVAQKRAVAHVEVSFTGEPPASSDAEAIDLGSDQIVFPAGSATATVTARALKTGWRRMVEARSQFQIGTAVIFKDARGNTVSGPGGYVACGGPGSINVPVFARQVSGGRFTLRCRLSSE